MAAATLQVDKNYNVYIGGTFEGTKDFDPGPDVLNIGSAGKVKYSC